ncbi:hypothetical protein OROGR_031268 [Orobanche gracilis]
MESSSYLITLSSSSSESRSSRSHSSSNNLFHSSIDLVEIGIKHIIYVKVCCLAPFLHLVQLEKSPLDIRVQQVVVATVAFGMGIDKSNVRTIIHYGWPQVYILHLYSQHVHRISVSIKHHLYFQKFYEAFLSSTSERLVYILEAYYQEAGRAGRDGKVADCVLYANLSRLPTLLPSQRSEEQTKQAYKMLSDCFRYGMKTSCCRAKMLVEYFGEEFHQGRCLVCDICINGPPEAQDLKVEATILLQLIATHYGYNNREDMTCDDHAIHSFEGRMLMEKPNIRSLVSNIREQNLTFAASDLIWWRGLARLLEDRGFIRDGDGMSRVQIKFPEPTDLGLQFLKTGLEQPFHVYPEADMLLSPESRKPYSDFSEWGKGWADPEIRRQRLERRKTWRKPPKKRRSCKRKPDNDIVLIDETKVGVQQKLELWRDTLEARGFRLSRSKTEYMECRFSDNSDREAEMITFDGKVVHGSTFFRYLGSIIQKDGELDGDVAHRIKAGWLKWKSATGVLCDPDMPHRLKGKFYRTAIRSALLYGTECWAVKQCHVQKMNVAEIRMLRWMCGHTKKDRLRNEVIREKVRVASIEDKMMENRLRWFGHVRRRPVDAPLRRLESWRTINIVKGRGRPKKTWIKLIENDMRFLGIGESMAMERQIWKERIRVVDEI